MSKKTLFTLWGCAFLLCAGLGFLPRSQGALSWVMTLAALGCFVPPAALLYRAGRAGDSHTLMLIRNLSALSLGFSALLLILNFISALWSENLGNLVHCLLVVVSSPMVCSGSWALSLFLWACLLMASLTLLKRK